MDKVIRDFTNKLVEDINAARLPIEVKRLVVANLLREITDQANMAVQQQAAEEMKGEKENEL